jgi:DNA sulfur modification protein DndE
MSLETIRLSQQGRDQLVQLKRHTGIKQWNVLCRWALCTSLADPTPPLVRDVVTDSNVEMSWKTFAGQYGPTYLALIKERAKKEEGSVDPHALARSAHAHIHRGVGMLGGEHAPSVAGLISRALNIGGKAKDDDSNKRHRG